MIGKRISRYNIIEKLGKGGMGEVYLAEDTDLKRKVALKFLSYLPTDEEVKTRFKREAQAAAALNHSNIITVYEVGEHDQQAFIAMEYVEGRTLKQLIDSGELTIDRTIDITVQISQGLAKAHQAGIVHRDLKPANIMIDSEGQVKILDFGLAKLDNVEKLTKTGSTLGTLFYMSPEQVSGEAVDHRSDIWSVGAVLYEMISGRCPFKGEFDVAVTYSITHEDPEPLARYKTGVSEGLQHIIDKALDKDLETRYQNVADLLADLKREMKNISASIKTVRTTSKKKSGMRALIYSSIVIIAVFIVGLMFDRLPKKQTDRMAVTHTQLTFTGKASLPTISPDGQYIAYFSDGGKGNAKIMVHDIKGGQLLEVFSGIASPHAYWLRWSPDGSELLLSASVVGSEFGNLYIIPRLGGSARRLHDMQWPCWSPDGSLISGQRENIHRILFTNKSSWDTSSIALKVDSLEVGWMDWSVVNQRLLFCTAKADSPAFAIWTINPDGSQQQLVAEESDWPISPIWSPRGNAIYYLKPKNITANFRVGTFDLMKLSIDPAIGKAIGKPKVIQTGLQAGWRISVSTDNKRLIYTRDLENSNLWLIDVNNSDQPATMQMTQLTMGTSYIAYPEISPDGETIAFTSSSLGKSQLFMMPIDGGQMKQLTFLNGEVKGVAWSPDGKEIAFGYFEGGIGKVWRVDTTGATPVPFANSQLGFEGYISWFPGSDIIYGRPESKNLHILNTGTQEERELMLTTHGYIVTRASISYDNKHAAVTILKDGVESRWLISLTAPSQASFHNISSTEPTKWSRDGKWIYGVDPYQKPFPIYKISVSGSQKSDRLLDLPFDKITYSMTSFTPDGKRIVCAVIEVKSDVWIMENFDPEVE